MRQLTLLLIVASVFPIGFAVEAAEQERCSALPTAAERIVCYDRQFPPDATPATTRDMHAVSPSEPVAEIPSQSPGIAPGPVRIGGISGAAPLVSCGRPRVRVAPFIRRRKARSPGIHHQGHSSA